MVVTPIQEHPAFLYNRIALRLGASASAVSAAAIFVIYPTPRNIQIAVIVGLLSANFLFVGRYVLPRLRTEWQLDLAVLAYLMPVFAVQWFSILLMPEKEVPAGVACLIVLSGMLFASNITFMGTCLFGSAMWLLVKSSVGSINEVEIMQMLVMTPSIGLIARLAVTRTFESLRLSREREQSSVAELQATLVKLQTETHLRKESEERFLLYEKNRSLGMMAAGVAHDFNNTLFAINSLAEIIEHSAPESGLQSHANEISKAVQQAAGICRQMLTYAGKNSEEKCGVDLVEVVLELRPLLQASLRQRVCLHVKTDVEHAMILGNVGQLQQVLMNLVTNGAEAIDGNGDIEVTISRRSVSQASTQPENGFQNNLPPGDYFQLAITDTGCGMSVDTTRQMFDPYFTTKHTGHGFGLSIVQGIARSHNATVNVQSQPGSGTTISLMFPANPLAQHGTLSTMETPNQAAERVDSKVVLLIDDDHLVRTSFSTMLGMLGWEIVEADSGEAALELLDQRNDFFAVVVDYSMPAMNGRETLLALRKKGCTAPAILCSGYISNDEDSSPTGEFAAILQKPFRALDLNAILIRFAGEGCSRG